MTFSGPPKKSGSIRVKTRGFNKFPENFLCSFFQLLKAEYQSWKGEENSESEDIPQER